MTNKRLSGLRAALFASHLLLLLGNRNVTSTTNPRDDLNARRLYNNLMVDYNRLVRPVHSSDEDVNVSIGLKMMQFTLNLKNQILSTNVVVEQRWFDGRLTWSPVEYRNLDKLQLSVARLWSPDIVLSNNADANYEIKRTSKVTVHSNGLVEYHSSVPLRSICEIDAQQVDAPHCPLIFGTWTKQGVSLQLKTSQNKSAHHNRWFSKNGVDLSAFLPNGDYNLVGVPAQVIRKKSNHHSNVYQEIVFTIQLRRRRLFYVVHLLLPCALISALSISVFYLPSQSKEKLKLSVSLLVAIMATFLYIVSELAPAGSLSVTLLNRYLVFTLCQLTLSIALSLFVMHIGYRSAGHGAPGYWARVLLRCLPNLLKVRSPDSLYLNSNLNGFLNDHHNNPSTNSTARSSVSGFCYPSSTCQSLVAKYALESSQSEIELNSRLVGSRRSEDSENAKLTTLQRSSASSTSKSTNSSQRNASSASASGDAGEQRKSKFTQNKQQDDDLKNHLNNDLASHNKSKPFESFKKAVYNLNFLAHHTHQSEQYSKVQQDWQLLAILLDRLFLWLFVISSSVGRLFVLVQVPFFS